MIDDPWSEVEDLRLLPTTLSDRGRKGVMGREQPKRRTQLRLLKLRVLIKARSEISVSILIVAILTLLLGSLQKVRCYLVISPLVAMGNWQLNTYILEPSLLPYTDIQTTSALHQKILHLGCFVETTKMFFAPFYEGLLGTNNVNSDILTPTPTNLLNSTRRYVALTVCGTKLRRQGKARRLFALQYV